MVNVRIARRYAEALVELVEEERNVGNLAKDLETVRSAIRESSELFLFLKSPVLKHPRKVAILKTIFAGKLEESTMRALEVVTTKGREDILLDIIDQFFVILDEREGIVKVQVRGATEFTGDQKDVLLGKLERYTRKKVKIDFALDRRLIGGFVARVGDTVLDGSVKRQLELLRDRFAQGNGTN